MAKYGNSGGRNKGMKYKKLLGHEVATPQSEEAAQLFFKWYGDNFENLRDKLIYDHLFCDEIATDTALNIYEGIALKGFVIKDYKYYYLRAYHTARLTALKKKPLNEIEISDAVQLPAQDFNYEDYEAQVCQLNEEILEYVRFNYPPFEASLFEIYIGLQPDTSYKRLAALLGLPWSKVWLPLGEIRKDVSKKFLERKAFLLTAK